MKVTTLEAAGGHAPKAVKFDHEIYKNMNKGKLQSLSPVDPSSPEHLTLTLHPGVTLEEFNRVVQPTVESLAKRNDVCQCDGAGGHRSSQTQVKSQNILNEKVGIGGDIDGEHSSHGHSSHNHSQDSETGETKGPCCETQSTGQFDQECCGFREFRTEVQHECLKSKNGEVVANNERCPGEDPPKGHPADDAHQRPDVLNQTCTVNNYSVDGMNNECLVSGTGIPTNPLDIAKRCRIATDCQKSQQIQNCVRGEEQVTYSNGRNNSMSSHLQKCPKFRNKDSSADFCKKSNETEKHVDNPNRESANVERSNDGKMENALQSDDGERASFIMAGLHACGDLTPTLLRLFLQSPHAVGMVSVPCCYMKLTCSTDSSQVCYPLSDFVKICDDHGLSWEAREMACHSLDVYVEKLKSNSPSLKSHSYRAALQMVLHHCCPDLEKGVIKVSVKNCHQMSFQQYVEKAVKKLAIPSDKIDSNSITKAESLLGHWKEVVMFYVLRLSLAPAVESLILLDRLLYLRENGIASSCLLPVFDPLLSPRNITLLAVK